MSDKSVMGQLVDDGYSLKEFCPIPGGGRIVIWQRVSGETRLSMHTGGFVMLFESTTAHLIEDEFRLASAESANRKTQAFEPTEAGLQRFRDMAANQYSETMYGNNS